MREGGRYGRRKAVRQHGGKGGRARHANGIGKRGRRGRERGRGRTFGPC